ncbi:MAG: hypothetical protein ACRC5M_04730 [Anaeroplasmataceae bacterium]
MVTKLTYKNEDLAYQPFHDVLRTIENVARSKNIQRPFSERGFEDILQTESLKDTYVNAFSSLFKGCESRQQAFKNCVKHSFEEHSNTFAQYMDANGNEGHNGFGVEGYGATAVAGGHNNWTRLAPVLTAGYLARSRALELYLIVNEDKPTFWREYTVNYSQKGLNGERLLLPKAIRTGEIAGITDLPLCDPVPGTINSDNENVVERTSDSGRKLNMIKAGTTGNLMDQAQFADGTPVDKFKHALERKCSIDFICVKVNGAEKVVRCDIECNLKTGKTSERLFNHVVSVKYSDGGVQKVKPIRVTAVMDLDTGNYHVLTDGSTDLVAVHFKVNVTNVANEMTTYMNGQDKHVLTFEVENKIYGSIPIIPEMQADYNAGGEGVSWVAYMTDQMTETYAGIRDVDLENYNEGEFEKSAEDFELSFKLGGWKQTATYPLIPRQPGGSDDILGPQRMAMKTYLTRLFTRSEKFVYFDKQIERQWIIMANDEDVDILPDVSWTGATNEVGGGEGQSNFRYGFSLDDAYGYMDNFGRKTRVIGSTDERWQDRPMWAVSKSLTVAAPTLMYLPYMFRVFSSISPDMRNRPAMLFASRDAKRVSTMVQARITLEGNDLNLLANSAAFAAGHTKAFTPIYTGEGNFEKGNPYSNPQENIPLYNPGAAPTPPTGGGE